MKTIKRFFLLIICLCLCASIFVAQPAETTEIPEYEKTFGYSQMKTDEERQLYIAFYEAVRDVKYEVAIPDNCDLPYESIHKIANYIAEDNPKAFYYRGSSKMAFTSNMKITNIYPNYHLDGMLIETSKKNPETDAALTEIKSRKQLVESKITEIVSGMPVTAITDTEKTKYIHDYIANNVTYQSGANDQTVYGALILGKCVCSGYAMSFAALCHEAGIRCWYISGSSNNGVSVDSHAWNVAWIDGNCLYTDVTWDDKATISYKYFNTNGTYLNQNHMPRKDFAQALGTCNHQGSTYSVSESVTVNLDKTDAVLYSRGETLALHASVYTSQNVAKTLSWTTSDNNVAIVSDSGVVTAVGGGKATITVTHLESGKTAKCVVTVEASKPHQHSIIAVQGQGATCTEPGMLDHFKCTSCGMRFRDTAGTVEVTNDQELKLDSLGHEESEAWNHDAESHWKTCVRCETILEYTRANHSSSDGSCSKCGYQIAITTVPQPTDPEPTVPTVTVPQPTAPSVTTPIETTKPIGTASTGPTENFDAVPTLPPDQKKPEVNTAIIILGIILCAGMVAAAIYIAVKPKK